MALEYSASGLNQLAVSTGVMAAGLAAQSEIFQFRNTSANNVKLLYLGLAAAVDATGFTAGSAFFDVIKSSAWTVSGTGGTAITLDGGTLDHTSQVPSGITAGSIRIATTAALGAGTKTLFNNAASGAATSAGAAGSVILYPTDLIYTDGPDFIPWTLAVNEGFSIRATVPATGTWRASVIAVWSEIK